MNPGQTLKWKLCGGGRSGAPAVPWSRSHTSGRLTPGRDREECHPIGTIEARPTTAEAVIETWNDLINRECPSPDLADEVCQVIRQKFRQDLVQGRGGAFVKTIIKHLKAQRSWFHHREAPTDVVEVLKSGEQEQANDPLSVLIDREIETPPESGIGNELLKDLLIFPPYKLDRYLNTQTAKPPRYLDGERDRYDLFLDLIKRDGLTRGHAVELILVREQIRASLSDWKLTTDAERTIFLLHIIGFSHGCIARLTGKSHSAVRVNLCRAKAKLRITPRR